ncbi:MAG TPA: ParA family protein [bacterium]|nr:ParA family protein [bacterium]
MSRGEHACDRQGPGPAASGPLGGTGTEDGDLGADGTTTARVIALVNQKGGCGKTTTAVNLAACLAVSKRKVFLIDLDPQANATVSLGVDPASLARTMYNILVEDAPGNGQSADLASIIAPTNVPNLDLAPSSIDLAAAELELSARIGRENALRKKIAPLRERYDYIIIDSPPSLGLLTINALFACSEVIIPIQTHYYALLGMRQLLRTLKAVREEAGHEVEIAGVVPTMYDARTSVGKEILNGIRDYFGEKVFASAIHFNIKLVESSMVGVPVFVHQPSSRGAAEYMALAKEVMALEQTARRAPARN